MIIISDKNTNNLVYFPKNIYKYSNGYKLIFVDRGTNVKYDFDGINDMNLTPIDFYTFEMNFSSMPQGEYEYTIFNDIEEIVGMGLIRLNELEQEITYYNDNRTYIAYDKQ